MLTLATGVVSVVAEPLKKKLLNFNLNASLTSGLSFSAPATTTRSDSSINGWMRGLRLNRRRKVEVPQNTVAWNLAIALAMVSASVGSGWQMAGMPSTNGISPVTVRPKA